jgi:hypothetical protein
VGHIALDRLHEVGDEVVPPLELHVDLGPGILVAVAECDEAVVRRREQRAADDEQRCAD